MPPYKVSSNINHIRPFPSTLSAVTSIITLHQHHHEDLYHSASLLLCFTGARFSYSNGYHSQVYAVHRKREFPCAILSIASLILISNVQFDDLTPLSAAAIKPTGQYDGADYQNLAVAQLGILGKSTPLGVKANTGLNVAATDGTRELLLGMPAISVLTSTSTMDVKSFHVACALASQESAAGVAQKCSVTITGIKQGAANVAKTVSYVPSGNPASMMLVTMPTGFTGLQSVTFGKSQHLNKIR